MLFQYMGKVDRIITYSIIKNNVSLGTIWVDYSMLLAFSRREMRKSVDLCGNLWIQFILHC